MPATSPRPRRRWASAVRRCIGAWPSMDSRAYGPGLFAIGMGLRALAVAALIGLLALVLATTHYYATALMLVLLIAPVMAESAPRYSATLPAAATGRQENRERARELDQMTALLDAVT